MCPFRAQRFRTQNSTRAANTALNWTRGHAAFFSSRSVAARRLACIRWTLR